MVCFGRRVQAFKDKADGVCLTELPAFALPRTTKQTGLYHSANERLENVVTLFRYSNWFARESILKLDKRKKFSFVKASHAFVRQYPMNILTKFHQDPTKLHTLSIRVTPVIFNYHVHYRFGVTLYFSVKVSLVALQKRREQDISRYFFTLLCRNINTLLTFCQHSLICSDLLNSFLLLFLRSVS